MSLRAIRVAFPYPAYWVALCLAGCGSSLDAGAAPSPTTTPGDSSPRAADERDAGANASQTPAPQTAAGTAGPAGGPCDSAPATQRLWAYHKGLQQISRDSGLWLDPARAAVIDVADASAPRVRGQLDVGDLQEVTPLAERRIVASLRRAPDDVISAVDSANRFPDELLVLGFDDPDAPTVLTRVNVPGEITLVTVTTPADSSAPRVLVIADELELRCREPSKQSYLYNFAFEQDSLVQMDKVALGDELALAERRGDYLVLIDGTYLHIARGQAHEPSLRVVSLKQDALVISERTQSPFAGINPPALKLAVSTDTLTIVSRDSKVSTGLRLLRYELSGTSTAHLQSDCVNTASEKVHFDSTAALAVLGDRILVEGSWAAIGNGPLTNDLFEINTACETQRQEQQVNLIDVPGAGVAMEITVTDAHALRVQLQDATHHEAVASAAVPIPDDREIALRDNFALTDVVAFEQGSEVERGLLGVATRSAQRNERILQLFSFSTRTITARGALLDATSLEIPTASGVATIKADSVSGDKLGSFQLDNADTTRSALGEARLAPLD